MTFPLLGEVGRHAFVGVVHDGNGDMIRTFNPPKDQPGVPMQVYGWGAPRALHGAGERRRDDVEERVVVDVELLIPPDVVLSDRDVVDVPYDPEGQFQVIGQPESFNEGPFGWHPGRVALLRKVEG
jgi:hypothetical protein